MENKNCLWCGKALDGNKLRFCCPNHQRAYNKRAGAMRRSTLRKSKIKPAIDFIDQFLYRSKLTNEQVTAIASYYCVSRDVLLDYVRKYPKEPKTKNFTI